MRLDPPRPSPLLSRRWLLLSSLSVASACVGAALTGSALAQNGTEDRSCSQLFPQKISKEAARHASFSDSYRRCGNCRFFLEPDHCIQVEGTTTPESTCSLWAALGGQLGCTPDKPVRL